MPHSAIVVVANDPTMTTRNQHPKRNAQQTASKEPFALFQVQNKGVFRRSCASSLAKKPGKGAQVSLVDGDQKENTMGKCIGIRCYPLR